MGLDLVLLGLVALFALLGWRSGAVRQVEHWAGLIAGALSARPVAARATPFLAPLLKAPPMLVYVALTSLAFLVVGAVVSEAVKAVLSRLAPSAGRVDQTLGAALGAGKGAGFLFLVLSVVVAFEKPLEKAWGEPPAAWESSRAAAFARRHDIFSLLPAAERSQLKSLAAAAQDPRGITVDPSVKKLLQDPKLQAVLQDPKLKAVFQDPDLAKALKSGDYGKLKDDPRVKALLSDPRLKALLSGASPAQ
ncbi:MAG: CvpA family protein [Elusimicrobia bacterium]|nr:CvpA family protein [Elusimicrobiota bacterium]